MLLVDFFHMHLITLAASTTEVVEQRSGVSVPDVNAAMINLQCSGAASGRFGHSARRLIHLLEYRRLTVLKLRSGSSRSGEN